MKLPDIISMELFQQYLAENFPKDGKYSTSGVIHELDSTVNACWKTLAVLGKLPHIQKWLHEWVCGWVGGWACMCVVWSVCCVWVCVVCVCVCGWVGWCGCVFVCVCVWVGYGWINVYVYIHVCVCESVRVWVEVWWL